MQLLTVAGALALAAAGPHQLQDSTRSLNDVAMPTHIEVDGHTLELNGMALRKKVVFKVYVAGLYLATRESDADKAVAADAPRQMVMHFLRDVGAGKICEAWNEGLENNTPNASAALQDQFKTLCSWMEDIKKGERFTFTYIPDQGTRVEVRGAMKGTLEGKEFADALLRCWIGPKPGPGEEFKKKLLGQS